MADLCNHAICKCTPSIADAATIDEDSGVVGEPRQLDTASQTATTWQWSAIRMPSASTARLSSDSILTPDVPDLFVFRLVATDAAGNASISTVSLTAGESPSITVMPASIDQWLHPGQTANRTMTIGNTGNVPLTRSSSSSAVAFTTKNSDQVDGPTYTWTEISGTGTRVPTATVTGW